MQSEAYEKNKDTLLSIFQKYCSYGEPLNTTRLKSAKFMKMIRDCNLFGLSKAMKSNDSQINVLKPVDVDLIYAKVTGIKIISEKSMSGISQIMSSTMSNIKISESQMSPRKTEYGFSEKRGAGVKGSANVSIKMMEFEQFVSGLELISKKIFPELNNEESLEKIICQYIIPLDKATISDRGISNDTLQNLMQLLKESGMTKFLNVVHRSLLPYFKMNANSKGLMTLEGFVKFCTDFELFPDVITKPRLNRIYYTIASIPSGSNIQNVSKTDINEASIKAQTVIDDNLFVEAIALCSLEVPYKDPQPNYFEKVLIFYIILMN